MRSKSYPCHRQSQNAARTINVPTCFNIFEAMRSHSKAGAVQSTVLSMKRFAFHNRIRMCPTLFHFLLCGMWESLVLTPHHLSCVLYIPFLIRRWNIQHPSPPCAAASSDAQAKCNQSKNEGLLVCKPVTLACRCAPAAAKADMVQQHYLGVGNGWEIAVGFRIIS